MPVVTTPSMERRVFRPTTLTPSSALETPWPYGPGRDIWDLLKGLNCWMPVGVNKKRNLVFLYCCLLRIWTKTNNSTLRSPRRSVCGGLTGWDLGAKRPALSPDWHWNIRVPGSPQYRWEVRMMRGRGDLSEEIFWGKREKSFCLSGLKWHSNHGLSETVCAFLSWFFQDSPV